jgi:hypothetical protein
VRRRKASAPATARAVGKDRAPNNCFGGQWCQASKQSAREQTRAVAVFDGRTALGTVRRCPAGRYRAVTPERETVGCYATQLQAARALPGRGHT